MRIRTLIDTSCLIAALCSWHEHHEVTRIAVGSCIKKGTPLLAAPSLVESFSVLTRLPAPYRLSGKDALKLLEMNFRDVEVITLTALEYWQVLQDCRHNEISGGPVYDAVVFACAKKGLADSLLTWNDKHFTRFLGNILIKTPAV